MLRADRIPANRLSSVSALSGNTLFDMGIPTEVVGSLPRPRYLQEAYARFDSGAISMTALEKFQNLAVEDTIRRMSQTGEMLITDGEQRSNPATIYPVADSLPKSDMALFSDDQFFAIFDEHDRQLPRLIRGPFRYRKYAYENFEKSMTLGEGHMMKATVVAPSMLYLLYPHKGIIPGYTREAFIQDLIDECEKDIRGCFEAGAHRVTIDFTEGPLVAKRDLRTYQENLPLFIKLLDRVMERFTPSERINIGIHVCPSSISPTTPSTPLSTSFPDLTPFSHYLLPAYIRSLPSLFNVPAGYFLFQLSSAAPADRTQIYKLIAKHIQRDANGVKQIAFIGVTDPNDPTLETPEEICEALVEAAKWIPPDQIGATDDFGFADGIEEDYFGGLGAKGKGKAAVMVDEVVDERDEVRDRAFRKITNRVLGARLATEKLGM